MTVSGVVVAGLAFYVTFFSFSFFSFSDSMSRGQKKNRHFVPGAERARRGKVHDVHGRQVQRDGEEIHKHQTCRSVGSGVRLGKEAILLCPRAVCPSPKCTPYKRRRAPYPRRQSFRASCCGVSLFFFFCSRLTAASRPPSVRPGWDCLARSCRILRTGEPKVAEIPSAVDG